MELHKLSDKCTFHLYVDQIKVQRQVNSRDLKLNLLLLFALYFYDICKCYHANENLITIEHFYKLTASLNFEAAWLWTHYPPGASCSKVINMLSTRQKMDNIIYRKNHYRADSCSDLQLSSELRYPLCNQLGPDKSLSN